jgi:hypothetical protein
MKKLVLNLMAISAIVLLFAGCAKVPEETMTAAQAAVDSAKMAEADRYMPQDYMALQDTLKAAMANVEEQKSKFFLSRHYDHAKMMLESVISNAATLKQNTETKKAEVRQAVQDTLAAVQTVVAEDKELLAKAPKGKEGKAALEAIQNDITVIESSLNEVNTLLTNGDYLTAQDKVNAAKQKADGINAELKEAIAKKMGKWRP